MPDDPHLGIGIFGSQGHQIQRALVNHPRAKLVAIACFDDSTLPEELRNSTSIQRYRNLDDLLADNAVQIVSLCSPRRRDQAEQAIRCLKAGKHVYAEKPCAMTEADLDAILQTVETTGCGFREMANGIAREQPYLALRRVIEAGTLGQIVQIFTQKSYPYADTRPQDENIDAGLLMQAGGHNLRMIEHVCSQHVTEIQAMETTLGNPKDGPLRMACNLSMRLATGGLALGVVNYLNFRSFGSWGNDHLRVFGTRGMVEVTDGGQHTHLVTAEHDRGPLDLSEPSVDFFDDYLRALREGTIDRASLEKQLHVTRMAIRAKQTATLNSAH